MTSECTQIVSVCAHESFSNLSCGYHLYCDLPAVLGDHGLTGHLGHGAEHGAALDGGRGLTQGAGHTGWDKCLLEVPLHLLRLVALDGEGVTKLLVTRGVILHPALVSVHLLLHQVIVSFTSKINSSFVII